MKINPEGLPDRKSPPSFKDIAGFENIKGKRSILNNGCPVYHVKEGIDDIIYIEWVFDNAGGKFTDKPGLAYLACRGLYEGKAFNSNLQLSEYLDQYGIFISFTASNDRANIYIYALKKNILKVLPILVHMITSPQYSDKQIDILKNNLIQSIKLNKEKNNFWSKKLFDEHMFGKSHPYGVTVEEKHVLNITQQDLIDFHAQSYGHFDIFIGGDVDAKFINLMNEYFGKLNRDKLLAKPVLHLKKKQSDRIFMDAPQPLQASIRLGFAAIPQSHLDYPKFSMVSNILGGYFGSRIMKNLREDKGYTYGISCGVKHLADASVFFISGDIKENVVMKAVSEIKKELRILRTEVMEEQEMKQHRYYRLGSYLSMVNAPFAHINRYKTLIHNGLTYEYFDRSLDTIKNITALQIKETAEKYFHEDQLLEIIVTTK